MSRIATLALFIMTAMYNLSSAAVAKRDSAELSERVEALTKRLEQLESKKQFLENKIQSLERRINDLRRHS